MDKIFGIDEEAVKAIARLSMDAFKDTSIAIHKELFPLVKERLMKQASDRPWQERLVLEGYLGGLEQALIEAEVQAILI